MLASPLNGSTTSLAAPKPETKRQSSISPTPRKRYTVALGGPIMRGPRPESPLPSSEDSDNDANDETIGKSAGRVAANNGYSSDAPASRQVRPKSSALTPSTTPLRVRARSQSTVGDRSNNAIDVPITPLGTKFVDPLLVRRQEKLAKANNIPAVKAAAGRPKVPVGQLVAFFDKDKA